MNTTAQHATGVIRTPHPAALEWRRAALRRRVLVTALVVTQIVVATQYMVAVLPYHGHTTLEKCIAAVFALLFGWISTAFWTTVTGFVMRRAGGDRRSLLARHPAAQLAATPVARTAVVMPICHEPVDRVMAGLRAVYRSLLDTGHAQHFDFFLLSDSRDPEVWLEEQAAWYRLCEELDAFGRIHYRRRYANRRYKSGNIADFLRRWGRDYEYMVILDADSLMSGDTIVRMVRLMWHEPRIGILQTKPAIVNAETGFARVQQFASRLLCPLIAEGLAALQLGEAAYWGHNAVIRVWPFMQFCGLRSLPAFGLFHGPILSHDFVEAAYMGRAGYEVWLEPGLGGSFEESPPSLDDELMRDRRWIKGNLQHLWVLLTTGGIRFPHRLTFINGILSYLTAPLWFAFLVLTGVETAHFTLWPIDYFPQPHSLSPLWPQWHPMWAVQLAAGTAVVLFLPKLLALLDVFLSGQVRGYGGAYRLCLSFLVELAVSTLLAPIRMMAHTRFVIGALLDIRPQWVGQNRDAEIRWSTVLIRHGPEMVLAAAWGGFALWLQSVYFFWSLPVALPLILAAPTIMLSGRKRLAQWFTKHGLLTVAEERARPAPLPHLTADTTGRPRMLRPFDNAVIDPRVNGIHAAMARRKRRKGDTEMLEHLMQLCALKGPDVLTAQERDRLAQDAWALRALHRRAWCAPPDTYWGVLVDGVRRQRDAAGPAGAAQRRAPMNR